jgi:hypothetical protein
VGLGIIVRRVRLFSGLIVLHVLLLIT